MLVTINVIRYSKFLQLLQGRDVHFIKCKTGCCRTPGPGTQNSTRKSHKQKYNLVLSPLELLDVVSSQINKLQRAVVVNLPDVVSSGKLLLDVMSVSQTKLKSTTWCCCRTSGRGVLWKVLLDVMSFLTITQLGAVGELLDVVSNHLSSLDVVSTLFHLQ